MEALLLYDPAGFQVRHCLEGSPLLLEECNAAVDSEAKVENILSAAESFPGKSVQKKIADAGGGVFMAEGEHIEGGGQ